LEGGQSCRQSCPQPAFSRLRRASLAGAGGWWLGGAGIARRGSTGRAGHITFRVAVRNKQPERVLLNSRERHGRPARSVPPDAGPSGRPQCATRARRFGASSLVVFSIARYSITRAFRRPRKRGGIDSQNRLVAAVRRSRHLLLPCETPYRQTSWSPCVLKRAAEDDR